MTRFALLLPAVLAAACGSTAPAAPDTAATATTATTEVIVMGMIHGGHRTNPDYDLATVKRIVRKIDPDVIIVEIPPDRLPRAQQEFRETGRITEPRTTVFPEYTDAIFPLTREMDFDLVGCAAWTQGMADDRRKKLNEWKETRPEETAEVNAARRRMNDRLDALGRTPAAIHTDRYDAIVAEGMEPYARLFNDDLGAGGWSNINAAHYALIARALDARHNKRTRVLITFGAWHKYWLRRALARRDDVRLVPLATFLE